MLRWRLVGTVLAVVLLGLFVLSRIEVPAQNPQAVAQAPAGGAQPPRERRPDDPPRQSMLRALYDALMGADEIDDAQRDEAVRTLHEADEILTRTKENNRRALAEVNRQVRLGNEHAPNIILIVADDLGYGELGSYGQTLMRTPEIDEFAAEGVRFTEFYAGGAVDPVSRYTLMTGLHSGHLPPPAAPIVLDDRVRALAEVLWKAGYSTDGIGKWNLGSIETTGVPWRQGFQAWYGFLTPEEAAFAFPEFLWRNEVKEFIPDNANDGKAHYADDLFTEEVLEFLELHPHPLRRPFFLYVAYTIPGTFREVPDDSPYADQDWTQQQKDHAAAVTRLDGYIGRIMDKLEEQGLERNTLVIFTSDTGPFMEDNSPGEFFDSTGSLRGGSGVLYEGGIRVPMIIHGWGYQGGVVSSQVWANWDILPTLADLTRTFPFPRPLDGISVVRVLRGGDPFSRELMYWTLDERRQAHAIRTEQWKGHRPSLEALLELYDLGADQIEANNVAGEHPEVTERIEAILDEDAP